MKYISNFVVKLPCIWLPLAIKSGKNNSAALASISSKLKKDYSNYQKLILNVHNDLAESKYLSSKSDLIDFYEAPPKQLNALILKRRNEHDLYSCPFCGSPHKPNTLDHFIPKDSWPEYSIFPNNLVPQCRGCAPIKGTSYYCTKKKTAKFIHPFYGSLLDNFRYIITVNFDNEKNNVIFNLEFGYMRVPTKEEENKIKIHLENLKVHSRVIKYCKDEYRKMTLNLSKQHFDVKELCRIKLSQHPPSEIGKDWKTALYKGILQSESTIDYLHSLRPKKNPKGEISFVGKFSLE